MVVMKKMGKRLTAAKKGTKKRDSDMADSDDYTGKSPTGKSKKRSKPKY